MTKKIEDAIREAEDRLARDRKAWRLGAPDYGQIITLSALHDGQLRVNHLRAAQARGETAVEDGAEARRQETGGSHD